MSGYLGFLWVVPTTTMTLFFAQFITIRRKQKQNLHVASALTWYSKRKLRGNHAFFRDK